VGVLLGLLLIIDAFTFYTFPLEKALVLEKKERNEMEKNLISLV
jgi:hypothetical protein